MHDCPLGQHCLPLDSYLNELLNELTQSPTLGRHGGSLYLVLTSTCVLSIHTR